MRGLLRLLKKAVRHLFLIFPLRDIILFESCSDFCDSTRVIFERLTAMGTRYKIIWLVENPKGFADVAAKYENVVFRKIMGSVFSLLAETYYQSIARHCIYTHRFIGNPGRRGQTRVFVTHASPPLKNSTSMFCDAHMNTDILSTSPGAAELRCKTLLGGNELIRVLGLPRNDLLFCDAPAVRKALGIDGFSRVIVWMPTFKRQKNSGRDDYAGGGSRDISLLTEEFAAEINELLGRHNALLLIKFHPGQDLRYVPRLELSNVRTLTNQWLLERDVQVYSLLGASDALITDFSSVYFDYLLTDKPVGFELTDMGRYEKGIGFLMDNPLDFMPGHRIYGPGEFREFTLDVINGRDGFKEERGRLRDWTHVYKDGNSADRVIEYFNLRGEADGEKV